MLSAVPVAAHHGPGTFDLRGSVTFEGATLTRVELINPHSWLYFDVVNEDGTVSNHRCEMRSAHTLRRSGWSTDLFPAGAEVTIEAAPDRADPLSCYLNTIHFADGGHMDRYGQYVQGAGGELQEVRGPVVVPDVQRRPRRMPSGVPFLAGDWAPEQVVMSNPRGTGGGLVPLSRLEEIDAQEPAQAGGGRAGGGRRGGGPGGRGRGAAGPRLYGGTALTARGERAAAGFDAQADNPRFRCETTSILFDWTFDGPVNRILQSNDTIVIRYGQMNLERVVHLHMAEHPEDIEPSRAGHSIGRWDGDVLVVDTVGFAPGVLSAPVPNSGQLHVVERFTLDMDDVILTREYAAEDPVYLEGQYSGSDRVQVADFPYTADTCKEQGFTEYAPPAGA
jgi:hypothetical protein